MFSKNNILYAIVVFVLSFENYLCSETNFQSKGKNKPIGNCKFSKVDIFVPLIAAMPELKCPCANRFSVNSVEPVLYRLQLKGYSKWHDGRDKFYFFENGKGMCGCCVGEEQREFGFQVKNFSEKLSTVRIFDTFQQKHISLKIGESTYSGEFVITLFDNNYHEKIVIRAKEEKVKLRDGSFLTLLGFHDLEHVAIFALENPMTPPMVWALRTNSSAEK